MERAHFRWNYGMRYTLKEKTIEAINSVIMPLAKHTYKNLLKNIKI